MLFFSIFLSVAFLIYLMLEKYRNDIYLASFQHIIHVNGIRGKTGVCRLIDANLRQSGYRVFTKTTGSTPSYIDVSGIEHTIHRNYAPNIREQLRMIRKAYHENAEILILECMAVNPELQAISQNTLVKGTLNVITNVRFDHIFDMGESLDEIAQSLSHTIPAHGVLFTADAQYYDFFSQVCSEKDAQVILCQTDEIVQEENHAVAYKVGEYLGISKETFVRNVQNYKIDFGAHMLYNIGNMRFLSLFSVNDPQSTHNLLVKYAHNVDNLIFVYNHRLDRPDRLLLFIRYFFPEHGYKKLIVMGENTGFARRMLRKGGCHTIEVCPDWRSLLTLDGALVVGIGNIKGDAYTLIQFLEENSGQPGKERSDL